MPARSVGRLQGEPFQAECVCDDRHRTEAHGRGGNDGRKKKAEKRVQYTGRDGHAGRM
jgi:hypothetical protein